MSIRKGNQLIANVHVFETGFITIEDNGTDTGTLSSSDLSTLLDKDSNYIKFTFLTGVTEKYELFEKNNTESTLTYIFVPNNSLYVKSIVVNSSTGVWTRVTNQTISGFETNVSNIKANSSSGNVGSLSTVARADHVHPFSDAETFADAEKQKTKNLFNKLGPFNFNNGSTVTISSDRYNKYDASTNTIESKGNLSNYNIAGEKLNVEKGKTYNVSGYLISSTATFTSSGTTYNRATVDVVKNQYGDHTILGRRNPQYTGTAPDGGVYFTFNFTVPQDADYVWITFSPFGDGGENNYAYFKNIQVEEGSVATSYQEYNGAIVHQKEMKDYAQPLVLTSTSIDLNNSTLTTLSQYIEFFDENFPKIYRAGIGTNQTSYLKTLLTDPFGETETYAFITPEVHGTNLNYKVWKVTAVARFSGKLAVGYLRKWFDYTQNPAVAGYTWTGWEEQTGGPVTLYDKESGDSTINKGYTSGFMFGTGSSMTLDSTKMQSVKLLRVYIASYNSNFVVDVPIVSAPSNIIRTSFLKAYSDSENADGSVLLGFNITILGSSHNAFWAPHATKNSGGTITSLNENSDYYIRKIEGVKV